jgi:hypothetical protein
MMILMVWQIKILCLVNKAVAYMVNEFMKSVPKTF